MTRKSVATPSKPLSARQLSHWQKERRRQRITLLCGSVLIVLIVGILGYGLFASRFAPRWQTAVKVDGVSYNMQYVLNYLKTAGGLQLGTDRAIALVPMVAQEIQTNELIKRAAAQFNIAITQSDVEETIKEGLTTPDEKDKIDPAELPERYQRRLAQLGVSDAFFREQVTSFLLRKKLQEKLEEQVPTQGEQVHLYAILLDGEEKAKEVRDKLLAGGDFVALAKEFSQDPAFRDKGGDLGWVPWGLYPDLEEVAFSLSPGEVSQTLSTLGGYYILKVTERETSRPIAEDTLKILKSRAAESWLQQARKKSVLKNLVVDEATGNVKPKVQAWLASQLK